MSDKRNFNLQDRYFTFIDVVVCLPFVLLPLFLELPYRVNIFLSWEGAYRLYEGQVPFRDFGLPMGVGYWILPAFFFKIFGPRLSTLIITQVFINILSLLSLRGILYNVRVKPAFTSLALLIFCLTYVLTNFWPWYNHSVVVFELCSFYFLTLSARSESKGVRWVTLFISAFLCSFTFFTKQDVGALCFFISLAVLAYLALIEKEWRFFLGFLVSFVVVTILAVLPFQDYDFFYWFNLGQEPHNSRLSIGLLLNTLFASGYWEKIYLLLFIGICLLNKERIIEIFQSRERMILIILCVAMIGQALVTQVTSPLPTGHMTYFHAFGFILVVSFTTLGGVMGNVKNLIAVAFMVFVLYSEGYWKYVTSFLPIQTTVDNQGTGKEREGSTSPWSVSPFKGFEKVKMPTATIQGIDRLVKMDIAKRSGLKVLNMSELTPLAYTMGFEPLTQHPLWYHLNIGIFQREIDSINRNIARQYYDLVLFEDIPSLNNFYPYEIRDSLLQHYRQTDRFLAPRKLEDSFIEVYERKNFDLADTTSGL